MSQQLVTVSDDGHTKVVHLVENGKVIAISNEPSDPAVIAQINNSTSLQQRVQQMINILDNIWASRPAPTQGPAAQTASPPSNAQLWAVVRIVQALARLQAQDFSDAT